MSNFIQKCLAGDALLDEIDDFVDQWHDGDSQISLHDFLGMKIDEYAVWVENPDMLTYIVAAHKYNISYYDAISRAAGMAARSSRIDKITEIEKWLGEQDLSI